MIIIRKQDEIGNVVSECTKLAQKVLDEAELGKKSNPLGIVQKIKI